MNKQRLFVASCISLVTTAMVFAIRGDIAGPMSAAFQLTNEQMGLIFSPAFWAFTIAIFIRQLFNASWQLKLATILVPAMIYLFMAATMPYPETERVTSKVSTGDMWREAGKPLFIIMFICMWMTAAAELGPDQWFPKV